MPISRVGRYHSPDPGATAAVLSAPPESSDTEQEEQEEPEVREQSEAAQEPAPAPKRRGRPRMTPEDKAAKAVRTKVPKALKNGSMSFTEAVHELKQLKAQRAAARAEVDAKYTARIDAALNAIRSIVSQ